MTKPHMLNKLSCSSKFMGPAHFFLEDCGGGAIVFTCAQCLASGQTFGDHNEGGQQTSSDSFKAQLIRPHAWEHLAFSRATYGSLNAFLMTEPIMSGTSSNSRSPQSQHKQMHVSKHYCLGKSKVRS